MLACFFTELQKAPFSISRSNAQVVPITDESELLEATATETAGYERLKRDLQLWTLAVSAFGISAGWLLYSQVGMLS